ncbi:MAG TPA: acyl-CoA dehydrogenase family protein, partial [Acidimicrobiia bacterium]|nr:acyl-CoA dehydrogenase family protein [Acidimicrobiia bacterium]
MDFTLSDDQQLLADTARRLFDKECPPALVRAHIDDPDAYAPLWAHVREYAALGAGPATDCCLFLDASGHAAAPGPLLATLLYTALVDGDGSEVGTVAVVDDPTMPFVLEVDRVERVAFVLPGPRVAVVEARDVNASFVETVDFSRRLFAVDGDASRVDSATGSTDALAAWRDRAHAYIAAETTGTARRIFTMALQYAKERYQFDVPIGSFQAIQHKLAEMSLALERATAAVQYAAMTVDAAAPDRSRACHVAKAAAGEAARRIVKDGIQIHGGIGYTWEHD